MRAVERRLAMSRSNSSAVITTFGFGAGAPAAIAGGDARLSNRGSGPLRSEILSNIPACTTKGWRTCDLLEYLALSLYASLTDCA